MLFYEQYHTTAGPDSKLNWTAVDIKTLYALMNSSFWIETINLGRFIVYINGSQVIIEIKLHFFLWWLFLSEQTI